MRLAVVLAVVASSVSACQFTPSTPRQPRPTYDQIVTRFGNPQERIDFNDGSYVAVYSNLSPVKILPAAVLQQYPRAEWEHLKFGYKLAFSSRKICISENDSTSMTYTSLDFSQSLVTTGTLQTKYYETSILNCTAVDKDIYYAAFNAMVTN